MEHNNIPLDGCYNRNITSNSIMPSDPEHSCYLHDYDANEYSYLTNFALRNMINAGFPLLAMYASFNWIRASAFDGNRDVFLYGGALSAGFLSYTSQFPLGMNDMLYALTSYDLIWTTADDINDAIYGLLFIPKRMIDFLQLKGETDNDDSSVGV